MTPTKAPPSPPKAPTIPPPRAQASTSTGNVTDMRSNVKRPGKLERRALGRRIVFMGVEGIGKTSFVAYAPNPCIVMGGNETGYETLMLSGRAPEIPALHVENWRELCASTKAIVDDDTVYTVIGFDAIGSLERLCHEYVCETKYSGNWGEKGFAGYQRGYDASVTEWLRFLVLLDQLKDKGTHVDVHHKTWAATHRWADAAMFVKYLTDVKKDDDRDKKGKGIGGTTRMCYTERRDAYDAKNRYGMPPIIQLPDDPAEMWNTLDYFMSGGQPE